MTPTGNQVVAIDKGSAGVTPGKPHNHVTAVWIAGDLADEPSCMGVRGVLGAMARGVRFYTLGIHSGVEVDLVQMECPECGRTQVAIFSDDPKDGDLLALPGLYEIW